MRRSTRSRFMVADLSAHWRHMLEYQKMPEPVNETAHSNLHMPGTMPYTTGATLDTNAGTPFAVPFGGFITALRLNVTGAPSGAALTANLLINGDVSNYGATVKIPDGATVGLKVPTDQFDFQEDDVFQWQIVAVSSATGPLVATIQYISEVE